MRSLASLKRPAAALALLLCLVVLAVPVLAAEGGGHPSKAPDYFKRALNFGLLAAVLVVLLRKPVGEFFSGRREQIATQLADLERARDEAKALLAGYERKLTQAAGERERILAEFVAEGETEKARILKEAEASSGRIKDAARLTIEAELKAAKRAIREELADAAVELAERKLRTGIVADDHNRLIDEYLTKVVELK
jgi:F-type H+-transporting ATPase subunit b